MRNIKLTIQYDGTGYSGWQFQKNGLSVQGEIEKALKKIFGSPVKLKGAGRTDAGVHALGQVANFKVGSNLGASSIRRALNNVLPKDIVISRAEDVPLKFDSQLDSKSKTYRYAIVNGDTLNPLSRRYATLVSYGLDMRKMKAASRLLTGRRDFKSFQKQGSNARTTRRTVKRIVIVKKGPLITIEIEADGFLYKMFRSIIGTLVEVGRGKIPVSRVGEILSARDRSAAGPTAPAKGLCLLRVKY